MYVFAVIFAFPFFIALILPEEVTVATFSLSDVNVTFPALPVLRVTFSFNVFPFFKLFALPTLSLMDEGAFFTVTLHIAFLPFAVIAVIVALPSLTAVILPFLSTVAAFLLLLVNFIFFVTAVDGTRVVFKVILCL